MDRAREGKKANRYAWVREAMPGVVKLIAEKRQQCGDAHVNECWQRGVVERQPGWFFAREGVITLGTPWDEPDMANFAALSVSRTQALLMMAKPGAKART